MGLRCTRLAAVTLSSSTREPTDGPYSNRGVSSARSARPSITAFAAARASATLTQVMPSRKPAGWAPADHWLKYLLRARVSFLSRTYDAIRYGPVLGSGDLSSCSGVPAGAGTTSRVSLWRDSGAGARRWNVIRPSATSTATPLRRTHDLSSSMHACPPPMPAYKSGRASVESSARRTPRTRSDALTSRPVEYLTPG